MNHTFIFPQHVSKEAVVRPICGVYTQSEVAAEAEGRCVCDDVR
jgi:hypothetical protein